MNQHSNYIIERALPTFRNLVRFEQAHWCMTMHKWKVRRTLFPDRENHCLWMVSSKTKPSHEHWLKRPPPGKLRSAQPKTGSKAPTNQTNCNIFKPWLSLILRPPMCLFKLLREIKLASKPICCYAVQNKNAHTYLHWDRLQTSVVKDISNTTRNDQNLNYLNKNI